MAKRRKNRWRGPKMYQMVRYPDGRLGIVVDIDIAERAFAVAEVDPATGYYMHPTIGTINKPTVEWLTEEPEAAA